MKNHSKIIRIRQIAFQYRAFSFALPLAPLHFWHLFFSRKLGRGTGVAARFAKAPVGILAFIKEIQNDSAKRGGRPAASARAFGKTGALWFREARRCPRAPVDAGNHSNPLYFLKSGGKRLAPVVRSALK